jgi:hypothetical protein
MWCTSAAKATQSGGRLVASESATIVQGLWNHSSVLRRDGMPYREHVVRLTQCNDEGKKTAERTCDENTKRTGFGPGRLA